MKRLLFLSIFIGYSLPVFSAPSWWSYNPFSNPFSVDYERMAQAFEPLIRNALQQHGEVNADLAKNVSESLSKAFVDGMSQGVGGGVNNLFAALNANMQANGQGNEAMQRFFDNIFRHLNAQLAQGGQGHEAANNLFGAFADQFQENGQGNRIFQEFVQSLGRIWQENGAGDDAAKDFFGFFNRRLQEGGEIDGISEQLADLINREAERIRESLQEGSNVDRALEEAVSIGPRNFNRVWDMLVNRNIGKTGTYIAFSIAMSVSAIHGTKLFWEWVKKELFRPKLLISHDERGLKSYIRSFFVSPPRFNMIFPDELGQQLTDVVKATRIIRRKIAAGHKNIKYRNLLLWGPPGTGKTMFAKRLAQESGLAWAHMSGASFSKFKEGEGIQELDTLMKWAAKQNGVLIFIDEAESLISKREKMDPNSKEYQLLNNFLNYTGERSDRFMLVMATNHKDVIDSAMHRRIDDLVYVPLPAQEERAQVLALYRNKILLNKQFNSTAFIQSVEKSLTNRKIAAISLITQGLSNGDLEGIVNTIKTDSDITESGLVTVAIIDRAVKRAMDKLHSFNAAAA